MTGTLARKAETVSDRNRAVARLFVLEVNGNRIHSMNPDGRQNILQYLYNFQRTRVQSEE